MNLILCATPLQMLIAKRIIEENRLKNNILLLLAGTDNEKFRHYYNELALLCDKSYFVKFNNQTILSKLLSVMRMTKVVLILKKYTPFNSCYLASVESPLMHFFISHLSYKSLYTYDDGTKNLLADVGFYDKQIFSLKERLFKHIFFLKDDVYSCRLKSKLHYTIFKDDKNIVDNTRFINLLGDLSVFQINEDQNIKIFVGQPLKEINVSKNKLLKIIQEEKIDYYYPHPREKDKIEDIEYIYSEKIFEDFVIEMLSKKNKKLKVYTFYSTAILNLKDIENVEVISVNVASLPPHCKEVYSLFETKGIRIINK